MAAALAGALGHAATFQDDFAADPLAHGWRVFGNTNLFSWNATNQNLEVTWDSSQSNSFFQVPLGTILTRGDDFSFALDLEINDLVAGVNPAKPSTFELAFGLQNTLQAEQTNFFRGNARTAPNLVEFDFFPDTGYGPTVWPAIWSTNSAPNYNGPGDYTILDLLVGTPMRISLSYTAAGRTLVTTIATNGVLLGPVNAVGLSPVFTDFRVGTFAVESYTDAGQSGPQPGSLLAHGVIDNVVLTLPPPPVADLRGLLTNGLWQVQFASLSNWVYALERTQDFQSWTVVAPGVTGTGGEMVLQDPAGPASGGGYRVRAQRL